MGLLYDGPAPHRVLLHLECFASDIDQLGCSTRNGGLLQIEPVGGPGREGDDPVRRDMHQALHGRLRGDEFSAASDQHNATRNSQLTRSTPSQLSIA
jgi:hypothetical protein